MHQLWKVVVLGSLVACSSGTKTKGNTDDTENQDAPIPTCTPSCTTSADCDMGAAPFDADNYTCDDGACVWTGCTSNDECTNMMADSICTTSSTGVDYCTMQCMTAVDCDMGSAPYDADNYACEDGACVYTGCTSTDECTSVFGGNYVCADIEDGMRTCTLTCTVVSDCSQGMETLDADNYECSEGLCVYQGCTSDQECASDYPGYICR